MHFKLKINFLFKKKVKMWESPDQQTPKNTIRVKSMANKMMGQNGYFSLFFLSVVVSELEFVLVVSDPVLTSDELPVMLTVGEVSVVFDTWESFWFKFESISNISIAWKNFNPFETLFKSNWAAELLLISFLSNN